MKRALCINSMEEISALIRGEAETIDSCLVDREICEDPNNKFLQIIPYVTFFTAMPAEGKLMFVQHKRAAKGNEDRLLSKTSIGFGGHIDQEAEIKFQSTHTAEDTTIHYVMTKQDLVDTCLAAAKREVTEELGGDVLAAIGADLDFNESAFFTGDQRQPVNQVHLGLALPVKLSGEQFAKLLEIAKINPEEIEVIDKMTANIRHIVEEMDVSATNGKIMNQLVQQHNVEDWSVRVFDFIVRKEIFIILKDINYDDLYRLAVAKDQARQAELAAQQQMQQSSEVISADAAAVEQALVPTETAAPTVAEGDAVDASPVEAVAQ